MAGGTWTSQNKVRPGVYIRFASGEDYRMTIGERGTVAICRAMSWGAPGEVVEITPDMETTSILGAPISKIDFLREMFKGSNRTDPPKKVLFYRAPVTGGVAATGTAGRLTATAAYVGTKGNDITIQIVANVGTSDFTVNTIVSGVIVDSQVAATVADLTNNVWVKFTGTGALAANAGTALTGGADGTVSASAHSSFLTAIEPYQFDVIAYDGTDATIRAAYISFVERLANEAGQYSQLVCSSGNIDTAASINSRFVIDVVSPAVVEGADGELTLTPNEAVWWVAGATAGAQYNQSLTYAQYPGAISGGKYTNNQAISGINRGKFMLIGNSGMVQVETDINTLTTYTQDIGKVYHKNRVMRLCNTLANDVYKQFSENFIGVVTNNESGRERLKAAIVGYMLQLQAGEGIRDFNPRDVEVLPGEDIDAVVVNLAFYALDAVEKIYMTVTVS